MHGIHHNDQPIVSFTVLQLRGVALNYAWGKIGKDSKVAQLASGSDAKFCIEQSKPYAEVCSVSSIKM